MSKEKSVSFESPVFLYEQVKIRIKEMISNGDLVPGNKLPNETELCETFNTSRITIRRALKELAGEGVIEIIHGKGTFVKKSKQQLHILNLKGFTEGLSVEENSLTKEILIKTIEMADEQLMKIFNREETFEVVKLVRIIKDKNMVFSIDYAFLPHDLYPGILKKVEDNVSTFQIIHNEYGVKFHKANKEIEVMQPSEDICKLMGISSIEPLIQVNKVIKDENDTPVHYSLYYLIANMVKFYIDIDMDEI